MTHVVNAEVVKGPGDLNLLLGIEKGVGELLALTEGALNNLEAGDIAQEIGNADVVAVGVAGGGVRVLAGLNADETGVLACDTAVRTAYSLSKELLGEVYRWHCHHLRQRGAHWPHARRRDTLCVEVGWRGSGRIGCKCSEAWIVMEPRREGPRGTKRDIYDQMFSVKEGRGVRVIGLGGVLALGLAA